MPYPRLALPLARFNNRDVPKDLLSAGKHFGVPGIGRRFACLTYHIIGELPTQYAVPLRQFSEQLALLKGAGYVVEGFRELECRLRARRLWPERYAIVTVDDGHESSRAAADELERQGFSATFFVIRDRSHSRQGFIRESDIRELKGRGFSLGTHGTTHRKLTRLPAQACDDELRESKLWLEDVLGEQVRYMAAPGGYLNHEVIRSAYGRGYALLGSCREKMNSSARMTLPGLVNRVNIHRRFSLQDFCRVAEGSPGFYLWRQIRAAVLSIPKQLVRG